MIADPVLLDIVTEFRDGILNGEPSRSKCYMVCAPLAALLRHFYSVEVEVVEGYVLAGDSECNHTWLRLADGRVLDPTADQFNDAFRNQMPPVYLGEPVAHLHQLVAV